MYMYLFISLVLMYLLFQVPYYQGELITFDVVPSKLTFSVNYKSVVLKVGMHLHIMCCRSK